MDPHPRNADANGVDMALLIAMPAAIAILMVVIYFLAQSVVNA